MMKPLTALIVAASIVIPGAAFAAKYKAPASVIATLPKYCLGQYVDGMENRPGYTIEGCGSYGNHFCPGLVEIAQARTAREMYQKRELLESAKRNMEYTLHFSKDYPSCFLRKEAEMQLQIVNMKLRSLH